MNPIPKAVSRPIDPLAGMNKTEAAYAKDLELRRLAREIVLWRFEPFKLRLAGKTFYTPDFEVMLPNGQIEFHEVKGGFWRDDARVKIKVAAETFPEFRFLAVTKRRKQDGGGWQVEEFGK
jgi:hypothetical protein